MSNKQDEGTPLRWVVYALLDPRGNEIRYVGVTTRRLRKRLWEHVYKAKRGGRTYRECWIMSLVNLQLEPRIVCLERGEGDSWVEREQHWVGKLKAEGARLTNLTEGGEGVHGWVPHAEFREAMSRSSSGRAQSPETRRKRSESMRGRKFSEEHRRNISIGKKGRSPSNWNHPSSVPIRCVETGVVYKSIMTAAKAVGRHKKSIRFALEFGTLSAGFHWEKMP